MNQPAFPAVNRPSRPLLTFAMTIAMPLIVVGANAFGVASARAEELRTQSTEQTRRYDDAVQELSTQRYSAAYGRFAALAEEGHAPSALMALAMVTFPPSMSGAGWSATPAQLQRWSALVSREADAASLLAEHDSGGE
jgi:uncharacterized protein YccT (UPF0319 family)